jgi:hypothetical protein
MQVVMPLCGISILSGEEVLTLGPAVFEFQYHYDDRCEWYRALNDLMGRLSNLGFTVKGVPVRCTCAFKLERLGSPIYGTHPMIAFEGGGADWLTNLIALLEGMKRLNETRPAYIF